MLALVCTPISAHHKPWHDGGHGGDNGGEYDDDDDDDDDHPGNGNGPDKCYNGNGNAKGLKHCDDYDNIVCNHPVFCDIMGNIRIIKNDDLQFPSVVSGFSQIVSVSPGDTGAALFTIVGEPCMRVQVEVVENIDLMLAYGTSSTDTIEVRDFTLGGSVTGSGTGFIDCSTGQLTNIRVGGTAQVGANNKESFYRGFLNLRAWYY